MTVKSLWNFWFVYNHAILTILTRRSSYSPPPPHTHDRCFVPGFFILISFHMGRLTDLMSLSLHKFDASDITICQYQCISCLDPTRWPSPLLISSTGWPRTLVPLKYLNFLFNFENSWRNEEKVVKRNCMFGSYAYFLSLYLCNLCPNLMNFSRVLNPPKTGYHWAPA